MDSVDQAKLYTQSFVFWRTKYAQPFTSVASRVVSFKASDSFEDPVQEGWIVVKASKFARPLHNKPYWKYSQRAPKSFPTSLGKSRPFLPW